MSLFNRKEKVPELPDSPTLPELPAVKKVDLPDKKLELSSIKKNNLPELPSFPRDDKNDSLNQDIVKSAVSDNLTPEDNEGDEEAEGLDFPPVSLNKISGRASIMSDSIPTVAEVEVPKEAPLIKPSPQKLPSPPKLQTVPPKTVKINKPLLPEAPTFKSHSIPRVNVPSEGVEPIFIRIDKFQLAKKNLEQIKDKVEEMEQLIAKIKTVKDKEEEDIKSWSDEVEKLKLGISEIDYNIFSQI